MINQPVVVVVARNTTGHQGESRQPPFGGLSKQRRTDITLTPCARAADLCNHDNSVTDKIQLKYKGRVQKQHLV